MKLSTNVSFSVIPEYPVVIFIAFIFCFNFSKDSSNNFSLSEDFFVDLGFGELGFGELGFVDLGVGELGFVDLGVGELGFFNCSLICCIKSSFVLLQLIIFLS